MTERRRPRVAVLGAGSWGTCVASLSSRSAPTVLWARSAERAEEIDQRHTNEAYLPGARLPEGLRATSSLADAVCEADVLVSAIPAQSLRSVLSEVAPLVRPWIPVVSLSKGLERDSQKRMTQIIAEFLPGHPAGALSGPNIARDIMNGYAAAATIAMPDAGTAAQLADLFRTQRFRIYSTTDVIGVEVAGALKNVYAIAVGMADGAGAGENTKAMVITRAAREMTRLGEALGGDREILAGMSQVAEGVKTASVAMKLAAEAGLELPIAREVDGVLNAGTTVYDAYRGLLRIGPGHEVTGEGW